MFYRVFSRRDLVHSGYTLADNRGIETAASGAYTIDIRGYCCHSNPDRGYEGRSSCEEPGLIFDRC